MLKMFKEIIDIFRMHPMYLQLAVNISSKLVEYFFLLIDFLLFFFIPEFS